VTLPDKTPDAVQSPCTSVCMIDQASGLCVGCLRTLDEIAQWSTLTNDGRREVIAKLPDRRALHGRAIEARWTFHGDG
jgi:uncharacterized protein